MPYEYEHFDPEFADAQEHNPEKMALLCPMHHAERTAGRIAADEIKVARQRPFNSNKDARWDITLGRAGRWSIVVGGNTIPGVTCGEFAVGVSINEEPIFALRRDDDGSWLLSASLCDDEGHAALRVEDNEVTIDRGQWDVVLEGSELTIWREPRAIVLQMILDGPNRVATLQRLGMQLANGHRLDISEREVAITGGGLNLRLGGNVVRFPPGFVPPRRMFTFGEPLPGDLTYPINVAALGKWVDWSREDQRSAPVM